MVSEETMSSSSTLKLANKLTVPEQQFGDSFYFDPLSNWKMCWTSGCR